MTNKSKVFCNFYFNVGCYPSFKDFYGMHINMSYDRYNIVRGIYHITDINKWFNSDFEEGGEYQIKRVSENGKYEFKWR